MNTQEIKTNKLLAKLKRYPEDHKGKFGHVMIIGGNIGFGGAGLLASKAAVCSGAGLVSLATRSEHISASLSFCPEVMAKPVNNGQALEKYLDKPSVICIGPGLDKNYWAEQVLYKTLEISKKRNIPLLIDADGLNLLPEFMKKIPLPKKIIITPHEGEAAHLLNTSIEKVNSNRISAAKKLSRKYSAVVVLKGHKTIICSKDKIYLCTKGNPGMASGGMGDVLSGIISSLVAQKLSLLESACLGVDLHAEAGDEYAEAIGQRGLIPSDIIEIVKELVI